MIEGNKLWMFVIYDHPRDYPDEFVCRRCYPEKGRVIYELELFARGPTIESIRDKIPPGQVCFRRSDGDDPVIVETWL
jgi:hypothetical protein